MRNEFTSPSNRPLMLELKKERESRINSLINKLSIADVKEDSKYAETSKCIKKTVLLTPVEMGKPEFVRHEFEEIPLTFEQQVIGGVSSNHYYHEVSFTFTGDEELLSYIPESGFSFGNSDRGLILPYGNEIIVEVDLPELNPDKAIAEAKKLLSITLQFVNANNASIQSWLIVIGQRIDEQLKQKREELIKLFGSK